MVKMRALKQFRFPEYGPLRRVGDVFDVPGSMRPGSVPAVLRAIGRAEEVRERDLPKAMSTYQTRAMVAQPLPVVHVVKEEASVSVEQTVEEPFIDGHAAEDAAVDDGLDAMEKDELHAMAKSMGLHMHHLTGAAKVRQAIREARAA